MYDEALKPFLLELSYDEYGYLIEALNLRYEQAPSGSAEEMCIEALIEKIQL